MPDLTPSLDQSSTIETVQGRISSLSSASRSIPARRQVSLLDGPDAGGTVRAIVQGPAGSIDISRLTARSTWLSIGCGAPVLGVLLAVSAGTVLLIGGRRGLRLLLALALTLGVVV